MKPAMVYFNFSTKRAALLQKICARCGIQVRGALMNESGMAIGSLFGMPVHADSATAAFFAEELLIMNGISSPLMDRFLAEWRGSGEPIIRLKAVVTPVNMTWTPAALTRELRQEEAAMGSAMMPTHPSR